MVDFFITPLIFLSVVGGMINIIIEDAETTCEILKAYFLGLIIFPYVWYKLLN